MSDKKEIEDKEVQDFLKFMEIADNAIKEREKFISSNALYVGKKQEE